LKRYDCPGACSLADHIALHEARLTFERESVDLESKTTTSGASALGAKAGGIATPSQKDYVSKRSISAS
jgi:glutathione S-transferase